MMSVEELKEKLAAKKLGIDIAGMTPAQITAAVAAKKGLVQIVEATPAATKAALEPAPTDGPKFVPPTGRTFTAPPVSAGHNGVVPAPVREPEPAKLAALSSAVVPGAHGAPDQETIDRVIRKPRGRAAKVETLTKPDGSKLSDDDLKIVRSAKVESGDKAYSQKELDEIVHAAIAVGTLSSGLTLLVNTLGVKTNREVILLSTFLAPVHAAIKEAHGVPHYMAIAYKGRAVFAETLDQYLTEHPFSYQAIFVDARTAEGADALPTLERHAGEIYRGV